MPLSEGLIQDERPYYQKKERAVQGQSLPLVMLPYKDPYPT
jgi:hypothetical protein